MGLRPLYYVYSYSVGINFRRQNLTSKVDPRAVRVDPFNTEAVDLYGGIRINTPVHWRPYIVPLELESVKVPLYKVAV